MERESLNDPETEHEIATSKRECELERDGKKLPKGVLPGSRLTYKPSKMMLKKSEPITLGSCLERAGEKNYIYLEGDLISEEHAMITLHDNDFIHVHDKNLAHGITVDDDLVPTGEDKVVVNKSMIKLGLQLPLAEVQSLKSVADSSMCLHLKVENAHFSHNILLGVHQIGEDEQEILLKLFQPKMKGRTEIRLITNSSDEKRLCTYY